ncbi:MAG TPA: hypothetical protein VEF76_14360 [Patescibacteria group bacterium]|nr:hypothetical protein [Patescibacteria group bacterium]
MSAQRQDCRDETALLQERRAPSEKLALRGQPQRGTQLAGAQLTTGARRRIVDARLWDGMSATQQEAAHNIALTFETLSAGLGFSTVNWERIPGAGGTNNALEGRERLVSLYAEWTKRCRERDISHSLIVDILVFGFSCRAIDRDLGKRSGHARRNLMAGLTLYCRLRGWNP